MDKNLTKPMNHTEQLAQGIIIMLLLISVSALLKRIGFLEKEISGTTSKIVLKITLPALIFSSLATQEFNIYLLVATLIVGLSEIICIALAWGAAQILKLKKAETGALMLVSGFGMSTMLGYPIIKQTFPGNITAMEDAVMISEIGVGLFLFIIGPVIAMIYGETDQKRGVIKRSLFEFITSPIFISVIAGIFVSIVGINKSNMLIDTIDRLFTLVGAANLFLVGLTIGLLVEWKGINMMWRFMVVASLIKLIIQPVLTYYSLQVIEFDKLVEEIALIETAMPSAIMGAIFARQYNCKPELVSSTILVTLIISMISVTVLFSFFF